jgi:alpha-D-ribose 1-methylphosphonate 5-triphosphate diphosphatase
MTTETVLANARIVLPEAVIDGAVVVRDGRIAEISEGPARGEDMEGDFVIPGLVELHTDHLEGHYAPRPKVRWNPAAAVLAHDAQIATAGITTVFDALRVGADEGDELKADDMQVLSGAIAEGIAAGRFRADHFIHLRCEVSVEGCLDEFALHADDPLVRMASLMDHSPGQRQFTRIEDYAIYYIGKNKMTREEFERFCERRVETSARFSRANRAALASACAERGIILASHDDATLAHVEEAVAQGIRVAEFPTTAEAAGASRDNGMAVLMGGPNVIRGGSHSGNVSARALASAGTLDIVSSDYIPFSMIQSAFLLDKVVEGVSLPQAVAMVTKNPAEAAGLVDRGAIETGRRGDLVRVRADGAVPVVRSVWREGRRVA